MFVLPNRWEYNGIIKGTDRQIWIWRDNELSIEYKRLTENELDIFIEMRINQLREEGAKEDIDLKPALKDYYSRHMTEGTFVSWIAVDGNKIIGTSGMSFVEKPPYFSCPSGKIGLLSSMFTCLLYTSDAADD